MSQKLMYDIIDELGGIDVHIKQIAALTKQKAPQIYVNKLMHNDLMRLRVWEYVKYDPKRRLYTIMAPYPESNIYHTTIEREDDKE